MNRSFKITFFLLFFCCICFAQNNPNSLQKVVNSKAGKEKIDALNEYALALKPAQLEKSEKIANEALQLAVQSGYIKGEADALFNMGMICYTKGDFHRSLEFQKKTLRLRTKINDPKGIAEANHQMGLIYSRLNDYKMSEECYQKALKIREKENDREGMAKTLNNLGLIYSTWGKNDLALEYQKRSFKIKKETGDKKGMAGSLTNIGNLYFYLSDYEKAVKSFCDALNIFEELGDKQGIASCLNGNGLIYENWNNYPKALEYYNKALTIAEEINHGASISDFLSNIGNVYCKLNNPEKAIDYYQKALKNSEEMNDKSRQATALNNIGIIYTNWKEYQTALHYYEQALKINEEINDPYELTVNLNAIGRNYKEMKDYNHAVENFEKSLQLAISNGFENLISENYEDIAYTDSAMGNFTGAFRYYRKYVSARDSVYNKENLKQITEIQTRYETEKKEREMELLSKENANIRIISISLMIIITMLILIGVLFFRQNKLRSQQRTISLEQRLLRSQMNPHFIFNSLTSIHNFILHKNEDEAISYLSSFASLMRLILENSREEYISMGKEIKTIQHYLKLQHLRYAEKFDYDILIDPKISSEDSFIPPMLTQPFIENAIEHGLKYLEHKGSLAVRFLSDGSRLIMEIEDNGIGREKAKEFAHKDHVSMATVITKERIHYFNKYHKHKIKMDIIDMKNVEGKANGTKVIFTIPLNR